MEFNTVDWVLTALAALGGIFAAFSGFFNEIAKRLGLVAGLCMGLVFSDQLAALVAKGSGAGRFFAVMASYIAIFMASYALVAALGCALGKLFERLSLGFVDRMFGFFLGVVEAALGLALVWMLFSSQTFIKPGQAFADSYIVQNILSKIVMALGGLAARLGL